MRNETEVLVVAALDGIITKLDHILDEVEDVDNKQVKKAEGMIFMIQIQLNDLMDRLTEEAHEDKSKAGST